MGDQDLTVVPEGTAIPLLVGEDAIKRASRLAKTLSKVIDDQKLFHQIEDNKYVMVDGWTTLGALIGVFPKVVKTEREERKVKRVLVGITKSGKWGKYEKKVYVDPEMVDAAMKTYPMADGREIREIDELKFTATVQLVNLDGRVLSEAQAVCSNLEEGKLTNPEYSISSMAQTRATGKAFRLSFSWVMRLAGYEATPWEEMADIAPPPKDTSELDRIKATVKGANASGRAIVIEQMQKDPRWSTADIDAVKNS